jgi:hypothetical protein
VAFCASGNQARALFAGQFSIRTAGNMVQTDFRRPGLSGLRAAEHAARVCGCEFCQNQAARFSFGARFAHGIRSIPYPAFTF